MLLDTGANVHAEGRYFGYAMQAALCRGHGKVVQMLMDAAADVNAEGRSYGSVMQAASEGGHEKVERMLLDAGADVNAQGGDYGHALLMASWGGHEKVVQMLLDAGADVNSKGGYFGYALQAASEHGQNLLQHRYQVADPDQSEATDSIHATLNTLQPHLRETISPTFSNTATYLGSLYRPPSTHLSSYSPDLFC